MRPKLFYPFFALAVLVMMVGLACGLTVDTTESAPQANPPAVVPTNTTAPQPVLPSPTPIVPANPGGMPPTATAAGPGPGPAPSGGNTLNFSLSPNYGTQALNAGFVPDPFEVNVTSGGSVNATYLGGGCGGYATSAPDFRLNWSGTSSRLRIMFVAATAGQDATLIINAPNGSWFCNDDSSGTVNPMVEFSNPQAGQYDIWVGSYTAGEYISGTLRITELDLTPASGAQPPNPGPGPAPSGGTLNFSLSPNYGSQTLSAGFLPDPFQVNITSGGTVDVSYLGGGCIGYATSAPDFSLQWSGNTTRLRIMFTASGGQDTTLIVNSANGSWVCNDDYGGLNPMVEFLNPPSGRYDIWVGSYSSGQYVSGVLKITEMSLTP